MQNSSEQDEKLGVFFEGKEPTLFIAVKMMFTWILIFTNLVPISLMVSLELVKFFQGIFMQNDLLMYDVE